MTLVVTHAKVSGKAAGNDPNRVYGTHWDANHTLTGTTDASQLNANVVQAITNDTNVTGSIASQTLTLGWTGTLAAARLNANVVQAVTNDTNIHGSISAQNLTFAWSGQLGVSRGGTAADLTLTGGAGNYLKQASAGAAVTVGTIPASDIVSGAALTRTNDTNVTLTLGGTPTTALLAATSVTVGWTGTLAASRGGFGADVSAQSGVPLFATGVATFTGTTGSGNFARATSPTFVTPVLGTPTSGTLTNCTGLPLTGLATEAANTLVGNVTGSSASPTAFTIDGLTLKGTPASTDEVIIWDVAGGAIKKATVSGIGSSSGVSSIASNTGAFTLSHGLTNSTNDIQIDLATHRGYLCGLTLSTAGSSATFSVAAGVAVDDTQSDFMKLTSAISKTTSAWAVGTGNGALDTGAIATSTWYHVYEIKRTDTGVVDILLSLSASSPTMPTSYTLKRRIGSMKTNGSSQWTLFHQLGDEFLWDVVVGDQSGVNPGTAGTLYTLTVPTGVQVNAIGFGLYFNTASANYCSLLSPDAATPAVSTASASLYSGSGTTPGSTGFNIRTSTSAQIKAAVSAATGASLYVNTFGWLDRRGRDS